MALVPTDTDPFATAPTATPRKLVPVEHDPFTSAPKSEVATQGAPKAAFPNDEPGYYYGSWMPYRVKVDDKGEPVAGTTEWAFPEMVRSPARGFVDINDRLHGPLTPEKMRGLNPDEQAFVMAAGGLRPSIAEAAPKVVAPRPAAVRARDAGYVLPPAMISENPGIVARALSGWSGKIKTQQEASAKNQAVTNQLAAKALGQPPDTVLTDQIFDNVRREAGKAYQAVIDAVPTIKADEQYDQIVSKLGGQNSQAAELFPKITNNEGIKELVGELGEVKEFPTAAGVELVKELRFNATQNLKALGNPSKHALGLAQREAANAVDDLMERNIDAAGQGEGETPPLPGVVDAYKAARKLIAKSYDVEDTTNTATGDVNARGLGRLQDKGRPLTDELKTIADASLAFPKAMQSPSGFGDVEPWSAVDFFGSAASVAHGNPGVAAGIMLRPVVRAGILSKPAQNLMTQAPNPVPNAVLRPLGPGVAGATQGMPTVVVRPTQAQREAPQP